MRRPVRLLLWVLGLYAVAYVAYVAKSAAGVDVMHDGVHHGPYFPGSDRIVALLRR